MQLDSPRKLIEENEKSLIEYFLIIGSPLARNAFLDKSICIPEILDSYPTDISKVKLPYITNIASVLV